MVDDTWQEFKERRSWGTLMVIALHSIVLHSHLLSLKDENTAWQPKVCIYIENSKIHK